MNYGTFSTSVSASFGFYCQGLGKPTFVSVVTFLDQKKTQNYQEAADLFSKALKSLKNEYIDTQRKTCRQEKILLQD